jgi:hypothetical protein
MSKTDSTRLSLRRRVVGTLMQASKVSLLNSLTLVNRQVRDEFLLIFCQETTFCFTLDASNTDGDSFWKLAPNILSSIRKCRLRILATPGIVGAFDPRHVSGNWQLRDRVFSMLGRMDQLVDLQLSIQACGNQLWNPIWLWHYTSQSFKQNNMAAFSRMSFDLEGWNMRDPNHLARRGPAWPWQWRCSAGHLVLPDPQGSQPIREFCGALYAECRVCDIPAS